MEQSTWTNAPVNIVITLTGYLTYASCSKLRNDRHSLDRQISQSEFRTRMETTKECRQFCKTLCLLYDESIPWPVYPFSWILVEKRTTKFSRKQNNLESCTPVKTVFCKSSESLQPQNFLSSQSTALGDK